MRKTQNRCSDRMYDNQLVCYFGYSAYYNFSINGREEFRLNLNNKNNTESSPVQF